MISTLERLQIIEALRCGDDITSETTVADLIEMGRHIACNPSETKFYKLNMATIHEFTNTSSPLESMINGQIVTTLGQSEFALVESNGNQMAIQNETNMLPLFNFLFSDAEKEKYLIPVEKSVE